MMAENISHLSNLWSTGNLAKSTKTTASSRDDPLKRLGDRMLIAHHFPRSEAR
jgi:hypothetical protein